MQYPFSALTMLVEQ